MFQHLKELIVYLPDDIQKILRKNGLTNEHEVVLKEGDVYIAVNVIAKSRRILNVTDSLLEKYTSATSTTRRILKG